MTSLSFAELQRLVSERSFQTISFDIDGTVYPILKVQLRWWKKFLLSPARASRFYQIKKNWEKRRLGNGESARVEDVRFFEEFLTEMLDESLVSSELKALIKNLKCKVYFLSDHGAEEKVKRLGLSGFGTPINCQTETGELKPHLKICSLLSDKYQIDPKTHLHLGDRWTDEEQAKLFGCEFRYFQP